MSDIPTTVALVTDEPIAAQGFQILLSGNAKFTLGIFSADAGDLPRVLAASSPRIVVLDLRSNMRERTVRDIQREVPGVRILLWVHDVTPELAAQAWDLHTAGILPKTSSCELTLRCLEKVAAGEYWFERTVMNHLAEVKPLRLTRRESQLVYLVSQGLSNKEVASTLFLTEGSVKVYLSKLFRKVNVRDRYELGLLGLRMYASGLLPKAEPELLPRKSAGTADSSCGASSDRTIVV